LAGSRPVTAKGVAEEAVVAKSKFVPSVNTARL
jgi:hypothetical protein